MCAPVQADRCFNEVKTQDDCCTLPGYPSDAELGTYLESTSSIKECHEACGYVAGCTAYESNSAEGRFDCFQSDKCPVMLTVDCASTDMVQICGCNAPPKMHRVGECDAGAD